MSSSKLAVVHTLITALPVPGEHGSQPSPTQLMGMNCQPKGEGSAVLIDINELTSFVTEQIMLFKRRL